MTRAGRRLRGRAEHHADAQRRGGGDDVERRRRDDVARARAGAAGGRVQRLARLADASAVDRASCRIRRATEPGSRSSSPGASRRTVTPTPRAAVTVNACRPGLGTRPGGALRARGAKRHSSPNTAGATRSPSATSRTRSTRGLPAAPPPEPVPRRSPGRATLASATLASATLASVPRENLVDEIPAPRRVHQHARLGEHLRASLPDEEDPRATSPAVTTRAPGGASTRSSASNERLQVAVRHLRLGEELRGCP